MGLEPTTLGTTIRCSNRLNYSHRFSRWQNYIIFMNLQKISKKTLNCRLPQTRNRLYVSAQKEPRNPPVYLCCLIIFEAQITKQNSYG